MAQDDDPFYPYHERRAALFMKMRETRDSIYRSYNESLIRQFEGVRRLTLLSPTVQYERAMEACWEEATCDSSETGKTCELSNPVSSLGSSGKTPRIRKAPIGTILPRIRPPAANRSTGRRHDTGKEASLWESASR